MVATLPPRDGVHASRQLGRYLLRDQLDLVDVGNVHQLANLLIDATYHALCLGSDRDASDFAARATPITMGEADVLNASAGQSTNPGNLWR